MNKDEARETAIMELHTKQFVEGRDLRFYGAGFDTGFDAGAASVDRGAVEVLRKTVEQYDGSDNGTCSVCRIGHRLYDLKGNIGICEWDECLSHEWRAVLARDGRGR